MELGSFGGDGTAFSSLSQPLVLPASCPQMVSTKADKRLTKLIQCDDSFIYTFFNIFRLWLSGYQDAYEWNWEASQSADSSSNFTSVSVILPTEYLLLFQITTQEVLERHRGAHLIFRREDMCIPKPSWVPAFDAFIKDRHLDWKGYGQLLRFYSFPIFHMNSFYRHRLMTCTQFSMPAWKSMGFC